MGQIVKLSSVRDDTLWAVVARIGRVQRVAEIFPNRDAALQDRAWREAQVTAHASFLRTNSQPPPQYSVAPVRRTDLPKGWKPLPALGFLCGRLI
jgi:hypothetical protein